MAIYDQNEPKRKCLTCGGEPLWGLQSCRECFRLQKANKTFEERILDLEISNATPHQHLENMRL